MDNDQVGKLREKYRKLSRILDERGRRVWAAAEAKYLPYGGVSLVAKATGMSRTTIHSGMGELEAGEAEIAPAGRTRKRGAGRKGLTFQAPEIMDALDEWVNRRREETQNRRCGGPARARGGWLWNCGVAVTLFATAR